MSVYVREPARIVVGVEFTRPADTTAYADGDAVSNSTSATTPMEFAGIARKAGGTGIIKKARLMTNQSANVAVYRLFLFRGLPASPANDNAILTLWANRALLVGHIDFSALSVDVAAQDMAQDQQLALAMSFCCASGLSSLWGLLLTNTVFTPASGQIYRVELTADQD